MKFLDLFKNKQNVEQTTDLYELFLSHIDELSQKRLRALDMALDVIKHQFAEEGFILTEVDCVSPLITLKRNQYGFYVDETKSLNSKEEFKNYLFGKEFLEKNKEVFRRVNQLILEKEIIMRGSYNIVNGKSEDVNNIALALGYCSVRDKEIFEEEPVHPTEEYVQLQILLDLVNNGNLKSFDKVINKAMNKLTQYFSEDVTLEIKRLDDKFDRDIDYTFGVMLVDKVLGETFMLYYSDGIRVKKATYDKYLVVDNPYIDIYLRIILRCLQKELLLVDNKKCGK